MPELRVTSARPVTVSASGKIKRRKRNPKDAIEQALDRTPAGPLLGALDFGKKKKKARRRNVAMGFRDAHGIFHPIRASDDYDPEEVGENEPGRRKPKRKAPKRKAAAKKRTAPKRKAKKNRKPKRGEIAAYYLSQAAKKRKAKKNRKPKRGEIAAYYLKQAARRKR